MLNWKHLKGFNGTSSHTTYSFIEFQHGTFSRKDKQWLPIIYIQNSDGTLDENYNYGHIVTSDINNQFTATQTFQNSVYLQEETYITEGKSLNFDINADCYIYKKASDHGLYIWNNVGSIYFVGNEIISRNHFYVGTTSSRVDADFSKDITVYNACNAGYFNSTSDIRAKENLTLVTQSMLDIINQVKIYTFNYKNRPNERFLGLIAQEIQDINIDGFSFVDNQEATGDKEDYMKVRESKLIYALIGAVQELSKQVQELKEKLGE